MSTFSTFPAAPVTKRSEERMIENQDCKIAKRWFGDSKER